MNEAVPLPQAAPAPPPGAQLAAARESSGLSVTDIARQLKLSPWQVEALESGDHARLPGSVFVRGFIRNYARVVKLDAATLLANAEPASPSPALGGSQMTPSAEIPFPTGREFKWHKYAIAAVVVVVPVVIFDHYLGGATPGVDGNSRQIELPASGDTVQTQSAAQSEDAPPAVAPPDETQKSPASVPDAGSAGGTAAPPAGLTTANPRRRANEHSVRFRFAQASWVEIRDRDGRRIFSQFNPAGTEQVVSGLPPLTLVVGNAKGVDLTYNEQPVDLGPHTKVDVARLTLE